jgi:hypothetical protein
MARLILKKIFERVSATFLYFVMQDGNIMEVSTSHSRGTVPHRTRQEHQLPIHLTSDTFHSFDVLGGIQMTKVISPSRFTTHTGPDISEVIKLPPWIMWMTFCIGKEQSGSWHQPGQRFYILVQDPEHALVQNDTMLRTTFGFPNRHYTRSEVYVRDIQPSGFTRTQPGTPQQTKENRYLQSTKPCTERFIPLAFGETYSITLYKELIKFFIREKMGSKGQILDIFLAFGLDSSHAQFTEVIYEVPDASCSHAA